MKKISSVFFLIMVCVVSSFSQYNSDFNITGSGARAEGFGGAFIGLADDATAVVWNPAGLTQLERPEASIVTRFIREAVSFKHETRPRLDYEDSDGRFALNFTSFALPIAKSDLKLVAAVSYQKQLDFFEKSKDKDFDDFGNEVEQITEGSGGVNTITPAIALKVSPVIAVGISINIWTGSIENKSSLEVKGVGRNREDYSADYSGLNFVIGSLIDFEQMNNGFPLKVGATIRTPFELSSEGSVFIEDQLSSNPGSGTLDVKQTIDMPLMFGFGASYRVGDNFTFAFDYELRNYAQKNLTTELTLPGFGSASVEERVSQSGKNLSEIRLGAEYLIVGEIGVIPIRAGFKTVPTVLSDVNVQYDPNTDDLILTPTGEQVKGTGFSLGSGFISDTFAIDITYGIQRYTQKIGTQSQLDFSTGTLSSSIIIYF